MKTSRLSMPISETRKRFAILLGRLTLTALFVSAVISLAATLLPEVLSNTASAAADRTPPTTPTNLRVLNTTSFSVSLSWNASTDNSGNFSYRIRHSWGYEVTVPKTQTSFIWTSNLEAARSYSFFVYAVDSAGNKSRSSNTVSVTLPRDTSPPAKPIISVIEVGTTQVKLAWSSIDDGPFVFYSIFLNGTPISEGNSSTSGTVTLLEPDTTYTFEAEARDNGINWSERSDPVTVRTKPSNPDDNTPPSTPTGLRASDAYSGEILVRWVLSTDDLDAQSIIRYDVFVNGVLSDITVGRSRSIVYGINGMNTISVVAIDSAGNRSAAATTSIEIQF
jgi:chitodextrinase